MHATQVLVSGSSTESDLHRVLGELNQGPPTGELSGRAEKHSHPLWREMVLQARQRDSQTSCLLPVCSQNTGGNWLNPEIVKSCKSVSCRPAHSSTSVCQRGTMRRSNPPNGMSSHTWWAWIVLCMVCRGNGIHQHKGYSSSKAKGATFKPHKMQRARYYNLHHKTLFDKDNICSFTDFEMQSITYLSLAFSCLI